MLFQPCDLGQITRSFLNFTFISLSKRDHICSSTSQCSFKKQELNASGTWAARADWGCSLLSSLSHGPVLAMLVFALWAVGGGLCLLPLINGRSPLMSPPEMCVYRPALPPLPPPHPEGPAEERACPPREWVRALCTPCKAAGLPAPPGLPLQTPTLQAGCDFPTWPQLYVTQPISSKGTSPPQTGGLPHLGIIKNSPSDFLMLLFVYPPVARESARSWFAVVLLVKSYIIIFLLSRWAEQLDRRVFSHFTTPADQYGESLNNEMTRAARYSAVSQIHAAGGVLDAQAELGAWAGWRPLARVSLGWFLKKWEPGNERTTVTTLHTETDQIFTASATRWIPTCWPRAWLATSWLDSDGRPQALPSPPGTAPMWTLLTVPSPEAVIKNTLDANSEWLQDTNGGGGDVRHRTRNPEKWCVEARRLLGG